MHTIVDVGSNTVRMNVYDVKDGKLKLLFNKKETVGLASYVRGQYMSAAGIEKYPLYPCRLGGKIPFGGGRNPL